MRPIALLFLLLTSVLMVSAPFCEGEDAYEVVFADSLGARSFDRPHDIAADGAGGMWLLVDTDGKMSVAGNQLHHKISRWNLAWMNAEHKWVWAEKLRSECADEYSRFALAATGDSCWVAGPDKGRKHGDIIYDDIHVGRYDKKHARKANRKFGATGGDKFGAVCADGDSCVVAGMLAGRCSLGDHRVSKTEPTLFVARLDSEGKLLTGAHAGFEGSVEVKAVCASYGAVTVAGTFEGSVEFGESKLSTKSRSFFVARLTKDMKWQWVASPEPPGAASLAGCAVTATGATVLSGTYEGALTLGKHFVGSTPNSEVFVATLTPAGKWRNAKQIDGLVLNNAQDICLDSNGDIHIAMTVNSSKSARNPNFRRESRIVKLSANYEEIKRVSLAADDAEVVALSPTADGALWVTGEYRGEFKVTDKSIYGRGGTDIFVLLIR
ncbi:MAG: hypothetical protein U5N86_06345 [Planctomycetota bacterium]|nr:hypothetical protein [Planctomycetota bacterium]